MRPKEDPLVQFMELTQCDRQLAQDHLEAHQWNLSIALDTYYEKAMQDYTLESYMPTQKYPASLESIFAKYCANPEQDLESQYMDASGLLELVSDLGYSLDDLSTVCLANILGCRSLSTPLSRTSFLGAWFHQGCSHMEQMRTVIDENASRLHRDSEYYAECYSLAFELASEPTPQLVLDGPSALEYWSLFFQNDKYPIQANRELVETWCTFFESQKIGSVHRDLWMMLLRLFTQYKSIDNILKDYDEMAAWPPLIDHFHEYLIKSS